MKKAATLIATLMGALAFAGQVYAQVTMGHVHLNVADVDAQIKFWTTQFDAKPVEGGVEVPGMRILLNHQAPAYGSEGTALDHFGFKVHSRDEMASRARAAGYDVPREFKGSEGFPNAYITGPDGVKVEVQEEASLKVRAVAQHLHFLVPDYWELRAWYIDTFSMQATTRGPHISADIPSINLTFATARTPNRKPSRGGIIDHIAFETAHPERWCKGAGPCFLTDPTGVSIEITNYNR